MSGADLLAGLFGFERVRPTKERGQQLVTPYTWPAWRTGQPDWTPTTLQGFAEAGYETNSLVLACIRRRAQSAAFAPLVAYTGERAKPTRVPDAHPLARLLRRPNRFQSWYQFMEQGITYLDLDGNLFVYMAGRERTRREKVAGEINRAVPYALYLLRSDRVRVVPGKERSRPLLGYVYDPEDTGAWLTKEPFLPEEVIHVKYANPRDPFEGFGRGTSPLGSAAKQVDVDNAATSFLKTFFDQGLVPYGLLKTRQQLVDADVARIRDRLRSQYGGVQNWGETMILDADADYQRMGMSFSEMTFNELDMRNEARICEALDIPPILVGARVGLSASTYSNYEQARKAFWQDSLRPGLYQRLEDEFDEALGDDRTWVAYDYSEVPALRDDETLRAGAAVSLFAGRVAKLNEARAMVKLEPESEDGYFAGEQAAAMGAMLSQNAPVTGGAAQQAMQALQQAQAQGQEPPPEEEQPGAAVAPADAEQPSPEEGPAGQKAFPFWQTKSTHEPGNLRERRELEDRWIPALTRALQKQLRAALPEGTTAQTAWGALDRLEEGRQGVQDTLYQMLRDALNLGLRDGEAAVAGLTHGRKDALSLGVDWSLVNAQVLEWLSSYTFDLVSRLNDNSRTALRGAITRWVDNGLPLPDLVRELTPAFGPVRAEMIAATEVTRSYAEANLAYWKASGVVDWVEWRTANDERVCPICAPLGGLAFSESGAAPAEIENQAESAIRAKLGEAFVHPGGNGKASSYETRTFDRPPAHVRCRCWLIPGAGPVDTGRGSIRDLDRLQNVMDMEEWARRKFSDVTWDLSGIDPRAAREVLQQWQALSDQYPEVAAWMRYIGTQQTNPDWGEFPGFATTTYAHAYSSGPFGAGGYIGLNPAYWGDYERFSKSLQRDVEVGWHPVAGVKSVFTHEFAHVMDRWFKEQPTRAFSGVVGVDGFGMVADTVMQFMNGNKATAKLSRYAMTSQTEAWAEGFAAIHHGARSEWPQYVKRQDQLLKLVYKPPSWQYRTMGRPGSGDWQWADEVPEDAQQAFYEWRAEVRRKLGLK